jgi:hypothetical protein
MPTSSATGFHLEARVAAAFKLTVHPLHLGRPVSHGFSGLREQDAGAIA